MPLPQGEPLEIGGFYVVAGQGIMMLKEVKNDHRVFTHDGRSLVLRVANGFDYFARESQIVRKASTEDVNTFIQNLKTKGVVDIDFIPCW